MFRWLRKEKRINVIENFQNGWENGKIFVSKKNAIKFSFYERVYDSKYWKMYAVIETFCNLNCWTKIVINWIPKTMKINPLDKHRRNLSIHKFRVENCGGMETIFKGLKNGRTTFFIYAVNMTTGFCFLISFKSQLESIQHETNFLWLYDAIKYFSTNKIKRERTKLTLRRRHRTVYK